MKPLQKSLTFAAFGAVSLSAVALAQTVQNNSTSSIIEVTPLEATPQRIAALKLPDGFQITKFAELENPRVIVTNKNGDVYISSRVEGTMTLLKDTNGDGRADVQRVVATRKALHGLAIRDDNTMFFMTIRELYRAPIRKDGTLGKITLVANDFPDAGQHPNRVLEFGPDGNLYISVGSTTNAANEYNEENATIIRADRDGKHRKVFATGLRNTIAFGWHPPTKRLIGWDQGMDTFGDNASKEEINEIKMGKRYGWPFIYENGKFNDHPLPPPAYTRASWAKMSQNPLLMYTAHSAGLQMTYYTGQQFPAEYKNDAFVTLRGSWNRNPPSGYTLARIHFSAAGTPVSVTPFISGFLLENPTPKLKWGQFARLVGVAQLPDGSLLLGDDTNNIVYRVAYGAKNTPRPKVAALDAREIATDLVTAPSVLTIKSNTFATGGAIPLSSTAYGDNISPDLRWSGVPKGTKSFVLMLEDPDARTKPAIHWLMANIPGTARALPKNILPDTMPLGAMQGGDLVAKTGYYGPKPPDDGVNHHYHFQLFALDSKLHLPVGYNRVALMDAMAGHVLGKGDLVGRYERRAP